jgi:hypothetical protein
MFCRLPDMDGADPDALERYFGGRNDDVWIYPAIACGFGVGLMVLGGLGLAVPLVNSLMVRRSA